MKIHLLFSVLALFLLHNFCFAEVVPSKLTKDSAKPKPAATDIYLRNLDKKFDRGAANFITGWTEIFRRPAAALQSDSPKHPLVKFLSGLSQGAWNSIADTGGGFANALTSVFPQWEIPLPQGGVKPETITGGTPSGYVGAPVASPSPSAA